MLISILLMILWFYELYKIQKDGPNFTREDLNSFLMNNVTPKKGEFISQL